MFQNNQRQFYRDFSHYFTKFEKCEPNKLICRNFKHFDNDQFKLDICYSMSAVRIHAAFQNNFVSILDKHAPKKIKNLQGNQKPHFNKNLRKQIMHVSKTKLVNQKILLMLSRLTDNETWWQIWITSQIAVLWEF